MEIKDLPDKVPSEGDKVVIETATGTGLALLTQTGVTACG